MTTQQQWAATTALVSTDPWLGAPSDDDRALVEQLGHHVDDTIAGAS